MVIHWASLPEGAERAWKADGQMQNLVVQLIVKKGLKGVRVYHRRTPNDVIIYLKDLCNRFNAQATSTTILEVLRQVPNLESSWQRRKDLMRWTIASVGQSNVESKKLAYLKPFTPRDGDLTGVMSRQFSFGNWQIPLWLNQQWEHPRLFGTCSVSGRRSMLISPTTRCCTLER